MRIIIKKVISILLSLCIFISLCSVLCFSSNALDTTAQYFYGNHAKNPMETEKSLGFTPVMTPVATDPEGSLDPDNLLVPPKQTELEENATRWGLKGEAWNGAAQWKNYTGIRSDGRINVDKCAAGVRFDVEVSGTYNVQADFFNNSPANGHYHYIFLKSGGNKSTLYSFDTNTITETADHNIAKGTMVQTYDLYLTKGDVLYFVIDSKGQGASGVYKNLEVAINMVTESTDEDKVRVFEVPDEFPQYEVKYEVMVDGKPMGLYSDLNGWNESINFGLFELREGETAEVSVTPSFEFETYKILPDNLGIESTRVDNTITYQVSDTTAKLSFVFDNDYKGSTLHLFTNPIDDNAPTESSDNVIYFGPGYHKLYETDAKKLNLQSGYTIYLAGGAVLEGCAVGDSVEDITITGSGMMLSYHPDEDWPADKHGRCVSLKKCENITIKNIMSHVHRVKDWTTVVKDSENIVFENYKVVSPRWASTDAMDIVNSSDVTIKNSFLRSTDDTITLKGMADSPENGLPVENITVEHTQLWSEANSSMVVGEEARAQYYKNIRFSDIDVLFSYDDKYYHEKLDERSVMSIVLLNGSYVEDIVWENIRVNECERLVCFKFTDTFYMGSNVGDQTSPGYIKNVTVKNVTSNSTSDSKVANEILIQGWDENKTISNVNFENVVIKGKKLLPADMENFVLNDYVSDITIDAPVPDTFEPTVLNEYSFGYKDKNSFSEKGMQNFFPVFSGTSNMPDDFPIFDMIGSDKDPVSVSDEWGEYAQWHNSTYEWAYVRSSGFIQPQKNTTAGVVWVAPKDGKYDINNIEINFNIASGATVSTMYYSVYYGNIATKEATRLFSYNNNSAESNEFLHRINLKKGDRLYFIMDLADNSLNNAKPRIRLTIKHVADTPDVPVATNQTATTITLNATDGYEYGYIADDGTSITYSDSNVIENLEVGKTYKIYQRAKATEAALASDDSAVLEYAMSKPGDIDRNNEIGATDLTILRKYLLNSPIEGNYFEGLMNANSVGEVDICDLVAIKKMSSQVS